MSGMIGSSGPVVSVRAPATSANLGPGFDALGLALSWHDEVSAGPAEAGTTVQVIGEGAGELPTDARHLVVQAMHATFDALGMDRLPVALLCRNQIPQARGLGSSSAAIVAGVLLAGGLARAVAPSMPPLSTAAALRLAARLEGHPDNVAPCLLGGFTIAWDDSVDSAPVAGAAAAEAGAAAAEAGAAGAGAAAAEIEAAEAGAVGVRAVSLPVVQTLRPVVFVPRQRGLTATARAALPRSVPHADAAHAAGRSALLVHALTREPSLLFAATEDRLHQRYRAAGAPETAALVERLRSAGVPAVVSGAGPSVLAFPPAATVLPEQPGWVHHVLEVDRHGATVRPGMIPSYTG